MDDTYRMKLKLGRFEFEAEGPAVVVQEQFKKFLEIVASFPKEAAIAPPVAAETAAPIPPAPVPAKPTPEIDSALDKIMRVEGRVISLTVRPPQSGSYIYDAVLLVLYGQKILRQNDSVTGAEVMTGITATGGMSIQRVDRLLEKMAREGDVIVIGEHRGKTYRLTNAGIARARQIATDMLAIVA